MTPIWMVYIVKYIPYRLEIWIVKTSAIFKPKVFLGWRLLSTFFSHRKCTHHSVSFHVGHRKISISHDDCSILHWLSNWNDFIALCGCIFVYLLLFFFFCSTHRRTTTMPLVDCSALFHLQWQCTPTHTLDYILFFFWKMESNSSTHCGYSYATGEENQEIYTIVAALRQNLFVVIFGDKNIILSHSTSCF